MKYNQRRQSLITLIGALIALAYGVFMLKFLNDSKKCDKMFNNRDKNFRKVAIVITWLSIILNGLLIIGSFVDVIAPQKM